MAGGDAGNAHPAVLQPVGVGTLAELQRPTALDIFVSTGGWASPARGAREATVDSRGVGRVLHDGGEASRRGTSICQWEGRGLARCERTAFFCFLWRRKKTLRIQSSGCGCMYRAARGRPAERFRPARRRLVVALHDLFG